MTRGNSAGHIRDNVAAHEKKTVKRASGSQPPRPPVLISSARCGEVWSQLNDGSHLMLAFIKERETGLVLGSHGVLILQCMDRLAEV